jgi:hypothetical protein
VRAKTKAPSGEKLAVNTVPRGRTGVTGEAEKHYQLRLTWPTSLDMSPGFPALVGSFETITASSVNPAGQGDEPTSEERGSGGD